MAVLGVRQHIGHNVVHSHVQAVVVLVVGTDRLYILTQPALALTHTPTPPLLPRTIRWPARSSRSDHHEPGHMAPPDARTRV